LICYSEGILAGYLESCCTDQIPSPLALQAQLDVSLHDAIDNDQIALETTEFSG